DCIIYPRPGGGIAVVIPTGEIPIADVARKDVPAGMPYRIVPASAIPADRTFRDAWTADFTTPDGYGEGA
ncbi:MAG: hypothetical protein IM628_02545, partial [Phenylobacterium sp.]|uniref:hypothetical protein n=1 Tax=Phenylobacterium sp. TaxID=1871053 RepID=UPI0025F75A95